ncbi:MAG: Rieske 2Fe-2S domain-containing protein [Chloroflexota bacterium]
MLPVQDNELLTKVSQGTPMGELMRRYWHPIAAAQELEDSPFRTKEVKILGEELVLYKDRRGNLGLIERYCSHRRVNLAIGVVEDDGLRCQYHGWKFDATGACVEQPFEDTMHPEAAFRAKCNLAGYPVKEMAGLVWAYMGSAPAPELPNWGPLVWGETVHDICITELNCNWLQCQENSLDPVHTEWLHGYFARYFGEIMEGQSPSFTNRSRPHQKVGFDVFDYGIIKRRVSLGDETDNDDWNIGHPILFPNILLVGSQYQATMQFRVPVDDENTLHLSIYTWRAAPGMTAPQQTSVPYRHVPLRDDRGNWILKNTFNQDYMAWITQGSIAKRHLEKLGESDRGIILFRQLLKDQIQKMQNGEPLMNEFRDSSQNVCIEPPLEKIKFSNREAPKTYVPGEAGYSRDAELIEAVMKTWGSPARELVTA